MPEDVLTITVDYNESLDWFAYIDIPDQLLLHGWESLSSLLQYLYKRYKAATIDCIASENS